MRNKQLLEFHIAPLKFNALSILYKGIYGLSFTLYQVTKSKKVIYGFPYLIEHQSNIGYQNKSEENMSYLMSNTHQCQKIKERSSGSLHCQGNCSFQTEKFMINYEEQSVHLQAQCIFKLEYDLQKELQTYLECKLIKKIHKLNTKETNNDMYCLRNKIQTIYETLDTQTIVIKERHSLTMFENITFKSCQFFASVDLFIASYSYGYSLRKYKAQLIHFIQADLSKENAKDCFKKNAEAKNQKISQMRLVSNALCKDYPGNAEFYYSQLIKLVKEHTRMVNFYQEIQQDSKKPIHFLNVEDEISYKNVKKARQQEQESMKEQVFEYVLMNKQNKLSNLSEHFESDSYEELLLRIYEFKQLIKINIRLIRQKLCHLISCYSKSKLLQLFAKRVERVEKKRVQHYVAFKEDHKPCTKNQKRIMEMEACILYHQLQVYNKRMKAHPFLFIENYDSKQSVKSGTSLTIMVHGYQGTSFDFVKAKNYFKRYNKRSHILIIESITRDMAHQIDTLGKSVSQQVISHISASYTEYESINFLGFSLGGVIARSALKYLSQYQSKMNIFVSFSSPHSGISECSNQLVNIGIWYLIKIDKVKNMKELAFQSVKMEDSYLMQLSKSESLGWFQKVVLVGSKDDGFVPYYSSTLMEGTNQPALEDIHNNIYRIARKIQKIEVYFDLEQSTTVDKMLGRKTHIQFLDNDYFLEIFFKLYASQF